MGEYGKTGCRHDKGGYEPLRSFLKPEMFYGAEKSCFLTRVVLELSEHGVH